MECQFSYKHSYSNNTHRFSYNLCPLFLQHQSLKYEVVEDTPPTQTKYVYDIALGNGLKKDGTLPADLQCPSNSFVCLTVVNTRPNHPSEPSRILQVVPVSSGDIRPKFRSTNTTTGIDFGERHLQLTVHGPQYIKQKQKAVFHMQCAEDVDDVLTAKLELLYSWNGTHVFSWRTRHGCPQVTRLSGGSERDPERSDDPEETLPPPDPEPDEDVPAPSGWTPSSPWSLGLVIILALVVLQVINPRAYQRRFRGLVAYVSGRLARDPEENEVPLEEIAARTETQPLKRNANTSMGYRRYIL